MADGRIVAYTDGGARGNPGPAGYGVRIEADDGSVIEELSGAIGVATNNVAEYRGLLAALTRLDRRGCRDAVIRSDSELLVRQMRGQYKVRHPSLQPLHREAAALVRRIGTVRFEHVPRSENAAADRLANAAMDGGAQSEAPSAARLGERPAARPSDGAGAVVAIGVDVESIARVDQLLQRYGVRFTDRVFTEGEAAYSLRRKHPAQHLAGRFAAKEAAMKALGTGRSGGVLWRSVEVVRVSGPPQLRFHGDAARRFESIGARRSLVTISHSGDTALSQVLLLGDDSP